MSIKYGTISYVHNYNVHGKNILKLPKYYSTLLSSMLRIHQSESEHAKNSKVHKLNERINTMRRGADVSKMSGMCM